MPAQHPSLPSLPPSLLPSPFHLCQPLKHQQANPPFDFFPRNLFLPSLSLFSLSSAAGIILSLFGGVRKHEGDANRVPVRGDVHALLVGDPGMGKSQLLKAAATVAPRGVYVCGSGASSVGLTVAVTKDGPGGEYAFEAGWWWGGVGDGVGRGFCTCHNSCGVYVCGSGASSVGLTVAVAKDGPGAENAFEAGWLVVVRKGAEGGMGAVVLLCRV
ncbi:unnamed protein product [Closterium sp. NIES-54]